PRAPPLIYPLSLHDALPILIATLGTVVGAGVFVVLLVARALLGVAQAALFPVGAGTIRNWFPVNSWASAQALVVTGLWSGAAATDRKSTRLNSSHRTISYAV